MRTNEEVRADMLKAQMTHEKVNGYKGLSPHVAFDNFDVVWQIGIDKMHNVDLGVTALMFKLFLKSGRNRKEYAPYFFSCDYLYFICRFLISVIILATTLTRSIAE